MSSINAGFHGNPGGASYPSPQQRGVKSPEEMAGNFIRHMIEESPNYIHLKDGCVVLGFSGTEFSISFGAIQERKP